MKNFEIYLIYILTLFFAVSGLANAYCNETMKEMSFPAVIDENSSQMIRVQIQTAEKINSNDYQTFLNTNPLVGYGTQDSINIASEIARWILDEEGIDTSGCNILVTFYSQRDVEYIDGPSAGAGLTVLMIAALENKTIRSDLTMTGTVEDDLTVGSIGGLALKGEAAYKSGYKVLLTPSLSNSEKIEMLMLKNYYDLKVLQVDSIEQAYAIVITPETKTLEENIALSPEGIDEYKNASTDHWYTEKMKTITEGMINETKDIDAFPLAYKANFETRIINSENALGANQFYTAANIAFLLSIDEDVSGFGKENMVNEYLETKRCIGEFSPADKTIETFEIVGPAEARYFWSAVKLNQTVESDEMFWNIMSSFGEADDEIGEDEFIAPLFSKYKDILNSKYWCFAGTGMNEYGVLNESFNKTAVNENALKNYTETAIGGLEKEIAEENLDARFHLDTAKEAMQNGKYVAALVDAAYIKSYSDIGRMNETEFEESLENILQKNYTFFWAKMFRNHAEVISEDDYLSALRVALIAENIENYFADAKSILSGTEMEPEISRPSEELIQKSEEVLAYQLFAIATVAIGIAFIAYVLVKTGLVGKIKSGKNKKKRKR
mgnify:CR=1 FL=1